MLLNDKRMIQKPETVLTSVSVNAVVCNKRSLRTNGRPFEQQTMLLNPGEARSRLRVNSQRIRCIRIHFDDFRRRHFIPPLPQKQPIPLHLSFYTFVS
uniref:Uncharacterized protein n=1 Tax=Syphacia muris TaxID=451379 RepID=A0A0N5AFF6_9BILA